MKPEIVTWPKRTTHTATVLSPKGIYPSENTCFHEGNSQYDAASDRIFVTVDGREELAEFDPITDQVAARYPLSGCKGSQGLLIDSENRLAFAACEENSTLVVFDLQSKKVTATLMVGADPDVLAFDTGLHRVYVSAESGNITIFDEQDRGLKEFFRGFFVPNKSLWRAERRSGLSERANYHLVGIGMRKGIELLKLKVGHLNFSSRPVFYPVRGGSAEIPPNSLIVVKGKGKQVSAYSDEQPGQGCAFQSLS